MIAMYLGKADVNTYDKGAGREFLVSNGRGSYGFSTIIGANTRREHGLLVVRPEGATKHSVLVSKIEETIFDSSKKKYQLSTNRYKDLVYPDGYRYVQEYQGNPFPSILFVIHSIILKKSFFMPQGKDCTIVKYELIASPSKIRLDLRPLFAHRQNSEICSAYEKQAFSVISHDGGRLGVQGREHTSYCSATSGSWMLKPLWFENLIYEQDDRPDAQAVDHVWSPGYITREISQGDTVYVVCSGTPQNFTMEELATMEQEAAGRFENILEQANIPALSSAEQDMIFSSYHLIDDRQDSVPPVYSGYPSVDARARDTFVALPGLTLATGREAVAERALGYWSEICKKNDWVMPGYIATDGGAVNEGADTGLWFVYAVDKFLTHVGTEKKNDELWNAVKAILDRYSAGIDSLGLITDDSGLLCLVRDDPARHWMNSCVNGEAVVSRKGYLVEINALWYNALKAAEKYATEYGDKAAAKKYHDLAAKAAKSFVAIFWSVNASCLCDSVDPKNMTRDSTVRPNQIIAVSLPYSPLEREMAEKVIRICWDELYTTYGLRTLDPRHDKFKGRAEGRLDQRMKARYRGMAWPWLLGHFISAYLKYNPKRKDLGWIFIRPFNSHLRHGCLGGIAELFDGIMPYRPHGDVLSAMALGDLLRVLHEDLHEGGSN